MVRPEARGNEPAAVEVAGEHPDGEREGEGQVREDQPAAGSQRDRKSVV